MGGGGRGRHTTLVCMAEGKIRQKGWRAGGVVVCVCGKIGVRHTTLLCMAEVR